MTCPFILLFQNLTKREYQNSKLIFHLMFMPKTNIAKASKGKNYFFQTSQNLNINFETQTKEMMFLIPLNVKRPII